MPKNNYSQPSSKIHLRFGEAKPKPVMEMGIQVFLGSPDEIRAVVTIGYHLNLEADHLVELKRLMSDAIPNLSYEGDVQRQKSCFMLTVNSTAARDHFIRAMRDFGYQLSQKSFIATRNLRTLNRKLDFLATQMERANRLLLARSRVEKTRAEARQTSGFVTEAEAKKWPGVADWVAARNVRSHIQRFYIRLNAGPDNRVGFSIHLLLRRMISSAAREENVRALASRQFPDAWHIKMEAAIPDKALGSTIIISGGGNIEPVARSIMAFVASLYSARHLPADAKRALPVKMESLIGAAQALSKQVAMDRASPHWSRFHGHSEELAAEAQLAIIAGDDARARNLYLQAAQWEEGALNVLNPANRRTQRTFWITAESAVALWYKAAEYNCARHLANSLLTLRNIPADPREALMEMLNGLAAQEARHG